MKSKITKNVFLSAAMVGLLSLAANASAGGSPKVAETAKGECYGVNACKGQGECGGKSHSCAGKNSCKGQGWITLTKQDCEDKGGTFKVH